jgi:hypothetical protein
VQADAEHEQNDAEFGELVRELLVGDEARRKGTDDDARQQVARDRRQPQLLGDEPEDECQTDAGDDGGNKGRVVRQCPVSPGKSLKLLILLTIWCSAREHQAALRDCERRTAP